MRPVKQIYLSSTASRRPRPAADRANDGHCDHAAETGSSERTAASASTSARLDRACTSVPGAHAVDGPGAAAYRNNSNDSGGDDAGSASSAVREVQTYLERSQSGSAGGSTGASNIATAHPRRHSSSASNNNAGSRGVRDLTNHPEIEYLAEATLVEEASEEEDDAPPDAPDGSRGSAASSPARGGRHNSGGEQAGGREDDISTLGPPPEVAQQQQRLERRESGNTNPTATDTVHGSMVITARKMDNVCGFISRRSFFASISVFVLLLLVVGLAVGLTKGTEWGNSETLFPDPDEVLTTVPEPICLSYLPQVSNLSEACPDPTSLPRGGPLCQLLAEAFLEEADQQEEIHQFPHHHIDIAIINAGAIRRDILPGDLTVGTVRTQVFPFPEDRAAFLSVTPAEIKATLETPLIDDGLIFTEQMQKEFFPDVPTVKLQRSFEAKYPYAAGLRYDVNISAPDGEKVSNILIQPPYAGDDDWIALDVTDESTLLRVVTSDYLAGGGDGYFTGVPRERIEILENLALADLFLSYCSRREELIGPDRIEDMSTREFVYDMHAATTDD